MTQKKVWVISIFVMLMTGCFSDDYQTLTTYREEVSKAEKFEIAADYDSAELHYSNAIRIADAGKWLDGRVAARRNLALMKVINGRQKEAEPILIDAWNLCFNEATCNGLDRLCDQVVRYYIDAANPEQALKYISELESKPDRIEPPLTLKIRLKEFSVLMELSGFFDEAKSLDERSKRL